MSAKKFIKLISTISFSLADTIISLLEGLSILSFITPIPYPLLSLARLERNIASLSKSPTTKYPKLAQLEFDTA